MNARFTALVLSGLTAVTSLTLVRCTTTTNTVVVKPNQDGGEEEDGAIPEEDGEAPSNCPAFEPAKTLATVKSADVTEASGIAASSKNPGVFWVHNDSGDSARVFAVGSDGELKATLAFDTAKPSDIEDIALEVDGDNSYLYLGDIGDNAEARTSLTIHRVAEPKLGDGAAQVLTATSEKMTVVYADGAHNAETLLFDPIDKELLIFTKVSGKPAAFHRIGKFAAGTKVTTEKIADFTFTLATGGEISRDGKYVAVRGYQKSGYLWTRGEGEALAAALVKKPCPIPIPDVGQGEALDFLPDGSGYVTMVEGTSSPIKLTSFKK